MLLLLVASVFTTGAVSGEPLKESQLVIIPVEDDEMKVRLTVLAFDPAVSTGGTNIRTQMEQVTQECAEEPDLMTCIMQKAQEINAGEDYELGFESVQNARVTLSYYNSISNNYDPVLGCENMLASTPATAAQPSEEGDVYTPVTGSEITYYYAECDISPAVEGQPGRTTLWADYTPDVGSGIKPSRTQYFFNQVNVDAAEQLTQNLNNMMVGLLNNIATSPLCLGVFLIMGLLLSSLYFAGKSPVTLLDITTPRLPQPKGVAAGGQILMPFGYTEMKRTLKGKMGKAVGAAYLGAKAAQRGMSGNRGLARHKEKLAKEKGTMADRHAGDVEENKRMAESLLTAAHEVGLGKKADVLAKMPYYYGDAENRLAQQVLDALERRGGKDALRAMNMRGYLLDQRTYKSLESLTGHGAVGKRDTVHYVVSSKLGKAFGVNRYAVIGGFVPSMYDSVIRTGKLTGRMTKAMVKEVPSLTRGAARTTMEMMGGRRAVEELEARAKTSATAAWLTKKHPSEVVIGQMFPVNDKMGHLYTTLKGEALHDEMRYVLRQLYKKMGMHFDVSEHELSEMGTKDVDILKRSGFKASAELAEAEREIRRVLANAEMDSHQKLDALTKLAQSHGAVIDHQMLLLSERISAIDASEHPDHTKLILLQEELERQNSIRMAVNTGGMAHEDAYLCHVGGDSLKGPQVWETMVLRTMIYDGENGHLQGGIRDELVSARLNVANRMGSLDPTSNMHELPEHMRNTTALKAVAERNRTDMISLFSEEGKKMFQTAHNKNVNNATINEMVQFMYGGTMPKTGHIDKKTGKMVWWGCDQELAVPKGATVVDMKRHWVTGLSSQENFAIGQWVESRFTRSYVPPYKASVEAELDRRAGSSNWTVKQRTSEAKKLWVTDQLRQDMEQRFNSQFGHNTYGTTRETMRFYTGVMSGFMEKTLRDKGMSNNHPEMRFLKEMDTANPKDLGRLSEIMTAHRADYEATIRKPVTYDDIAKSNQAMVMLHEGGFAYYKKNMMLSDMDRVMGGEVALKDNKGQLRKFIPEDVTINFGGRDDLTREFYKVSSSKDPNHWSNFLESATKWKNEGGYNYDKEKVYAAATWQYANTTWDYSKFWRNSAVSVEAKRSVTPAAPSPMRFFGADAPKFTEKFMKPFRDMGLHAGDYVSKVALAAGGPLHTVSYDITPTSELSRQHSMQLASRILSGRDMEGLSEAEKTAYRQVAMEHAAYHQVWDYAIDRNPWRASTSMGTHQSWSARFHFGPAANFDVKDNLRAYMGKGEYANFMAGYGFPMNLAGRMMRPYTNMIRGMQSSMQGYACKFDQTGDSLRQWNYTQPRLLEAMQSLNPMSFKLFPGKTGDRIQSLNKFGGSLEKHQLAGPDFEAGLREAPQDVFLQRKGVYAAARTGEVNPGSSFYNYRHEMQYEAPMAEYLLRTKDVSYMYDKKVQEAAMNNTVRRTVSAEALALRRDQELRGFGIMQNPIMGWANPLAFAYHMPVPVWPTGATPRDIISGYVRRSKEGRGGSFSDSLRGVAQGISSGTKRLMQPHKLSMTVYCQKCSKAGFRGSRCACGGILY